jgi:hypothetical protein
MYAVFYVLVSSVSVQDTVDDGDDDDDDDCMCTVTSVLHFTCLQPNVSMSERRNKEHRTVDSREFSYIRPY